MSLPEYFCWTRFGTEAGQPIEQILSRKEEERAANRGTFLWGIGNALGPSIEELIRREETPEVLFSPTKSPPKKQDAAPSLVVVWTSARTRTGQDFTLPAHSVVTSRGRDRVLKAAHYALVCYSDQPLFLSKSKSQIDLGSLRNLRTGNRVGASQVTAVVETKRVPTARQSLYEVPFRARLVRPYFVRLSDPVPLAGPRSESQDWSDVLRDFLNRKWA